MRGEAAVLNEGLLRFSCEDVSGWWRSDYGYSANEQELQMVDHWLAGWVTGLRCLAEQVMQENNLAAMLQPDSEWFDECFRYWQSEVLDTLPDELLQRLMNISLYETFSADEWQLMTGEHSPIGENGLEQAKRHRLLDAVPPNRWRLHPILRELLQRKLRLHPARFQRLSLQAARYEAANGRLLAALAFYLLIEEWEEIAALLTESGSELLENGYVDELYRWLLLVPDGIKERYPRLWYAQGEIERSRCLYPQAICSYTSYAAICDASGDRIGQCLGLEGQARVHMDSVQGLKAEQLLKQAVSILEEDDSQLAARLYRTLAEIYTNRGNTHLARHWYERSRTCEEQPEVEVEARLLFRTGRLQAAIQLLEQNWRPDEGNNQPLTRSFRETSLVLAFVYALIGAKEKGIEVAEDAIRLGQAANSPFVEAYGYIRKAHCLLLLPTLDSEEVRALYQRGLAMLEELNSNRGKAETLLGFTLFHGRENRLDAALACAERGLWETEVIQDEWVNGLLRLAMGIAYVHHEQYRQAEPVLLQCVERFSRCGDPYNVAICRLWLSYLHYKQGDWERFVPMVTAALTAIQAGNFPFLLERPTMCTPTDVQGLLPLLLEAQKRQIQPGYVSQLLSERGLQNVSFHPGYSLRIQTFGQFRVWLGQQELTERAWQRGKAKQLFQLLLTRRHQLLAREEIMELLWSGQDEETAMRDFKVALNALNKALEPNREPRATPFFIQRHGTSYGLNLAAGHLLDAEDFERLVSRGMMAADRKQGVQWLEKGLSLYQGDYLPDCRYDDWCREERERLEMLYLRGAERLAQVLMAMEQYEEAIHWCEKILLVDDCWEEAYRLLMIGYYRNNNRALSVKWYEKCKAKLREQLGVAPLPSTQDTFELIMDQRLNRE